MHRIEDDILFMRLEKAIATTPAALLDGLASPDRWRRHVAVGEIARHLVDRLRCFDISRAQCPTRSDVQPELFPSDLAPLG